MTGSVYLVGIKNGKNNHLSAGVIQKVADCTPSAEGQTQK
jgi:hypothetical protein